MKQKETISMEEMADKLNVNIKTIKRDLQKLKQKRLLRRIGPAKDGHMRGLKTNPLNHIFGCHLKNGLLKPMQLA